MISWIFDSLPGGRVKCRLQPKVDLRTFFFLDRKKCSSNCLGSNLCKVSLSRVEKLFEKKSATLGLI